MATEELFARENHLCCSDIGRGATLLHRHSERLLAKHLVRESTVARSIELQRMLRIANLEGEESVPVGCRVVEDAMIRVNLADGHFGDNAVRPFDRPADVLPLCPSRYTEKQYQE